MAEHEHLVVALARAYSLSELLPVEDPRIREELQTVADGLDGTLVLRLDGERLVAGDGKSVAGEEAITAELAEDLQLAGVAEVRVPADVELENLEAFVRSLRRGSGEGDGERTARELARELPQIGVGFGARGPARSRRARSVATLFSGEGAGGRPSPGAADAGEEGRADISSAALESAVDAYLEAAPSERAEAEEVLREAVGDARERGDVEGLATAVGRLALDATEGSPDRESLDLAREILTPGAATRLAVRLGSLRDEEERDALMRACGELGEEMASALAEALADTSDRSARRTYIQAMVAVGDPARDQVERMLDDSRWFVVRNGVRVLGGIGTEDDVEHLTSPLAHDDARVRLETVRALGRIGGEDAGMLLLGMLDDPEADVRAAAATALGALGVERAVKVLLERLEREESEKVQVQILRALGAIGDPGAVPAIEKRAVTSFFSRPSPELRIAGYRALASIGTPHAVKLLEEARDDRDEEVRSAVRSLLSSREA